jgi:hypothetical protein
VTLPTLDEHVTFENPADGRGGLVPWRAEVAGGNTLGSVAMTSVPAPEGALFGQAVWNESEYRGTRSTRGVEGRGARHVGPLWYSFQLRVPSGGFPSDKSQIVAQLIAWHPQCETDKTIAVSLLNDKLSAASWAGDTPIDNGGTPFYPTVVLNGEYGLTDAMPRDRWLRVVLHARPSNQGTGIFEGWLLDEQGAEMASFSQRDINLGTGCFHPNGELLYGVYPKFGIYAYGVAAYTPGETRTLYFDDARVLYGEPACAFEAVTR